MKRKETIHQIDTIRIFSSKLQDFFIKFQSNQKTTINSHCLHCFSNQPYLLLYHEIYITIGPLHLTISNSNPFPKIENVTNNNDTF
jgi:hypothetical protein